MPHTSQWLVEGRMGEIVATGPFTTAEALRPLADDMVAFCQASLGPLMHVLFDASGTTALPDTLDVMYEGLKEAVAMPNFGWFLLVLPQGETRKKKYFYYIVTQKYQLRYREFETREAALEFVYYVDVTLEAGLPPDLSDVLPKS